MPIWLGSTPPHMLSGHGLSPRMIATCTSFVGEFCGVCVSLMDGRESQEGAGADLLLYDDAELRARRDARTVGRLDDGRALGERGEREGGEDEDALHDRCWG